MEQRQCDQCSWLIPRQQPGVWCGKRMKEIKEGCRREEEVKGNTVQCICLHTGVIRLSFSVKIKFFYMQKNVIEYLFGNECERMSMFCALVWRSVVIGATRLSFVTQLPPC